MAATTEAQSQVEETSIWVWIAGAGALLVLLLPAVSRLGRPRRWPWSFTATGALGVVLAMVLLGMLGGIIAGMLASTDAPQAEPTLQEVGAAMIGGWSGQLVALVLAFAVAVIRPPRHRARMRTASAQGAIGVGIVGLLVFWPLTLVTVEVGALVHEALRGVRPPQEAHALLQMLIEAGPSPLGWAIVAAAACGPAFFEEVMYRGMMQSGLQRSSWGRRVGPWKVIAVTSLVFMLMHSGAVEVAALPGLFVLSLGFGWAFVQTGRLLAPITMHLLFNAGNLLLAVPWITS